MSAQIANAENECVAEVEVEVEKEEEELQDSVEYMTFEEFKKLILAKTLGKRPFLELFGKKEGEFYNKHNIPIEIFETEEKFNESSHPMDRIYLIEKGISSDGKGLFIPADLSFLTIENYIATSTKKTYAVINSLEQKNEDMTIKDLLKRFDCKKMEQIWNLLSLEFSSSNTKLDKNFSLPTMVRSESMIYNLEKSLRNEKSEINKKLTITVNNKEKESMKKRKETVDRQLKTMPKYHKFVLLSMEGSFTDAHIDFSGTAVYYHVVKGEKIFYVAKPTPENIEIYKKYEERTIFDDIPWIGISLFDKWQRVVIKEGQTAILPPGYIHFVYTPKHSLVIGGNFLLLSHLTEHFLISKLDQEGVQSGHLDVSNTFVGFSNAIISYLENVFIKEMEELKNNRVCLTSLHKEHAQKFYIGISQILNESKASDHDWYSPDEVRKILGKLASLFPMIKRIKVAAPKKRNIPESTESEGDQFQPSTSKKSA